jgi:hypothetical protein
VNAKGRTWWPKKEDQWIKRRIRRGARWSHSWSAYHHSIPVFWQQVAFSDWYWWNTTPDEAHFAEQLAEVQSGTQRRSRHDRQHDNRRTRQVGKRVCYHEIAAHPAFWAMDLLEQHKAEWQRYWDEHGEGHLGWERPYDAWIELQARPSSLEHPDRLKAEYLGTGFKYGSFAWDIMEED